MSARSQESAAPSFRLASECAGAFCFLNGLCVLSGWVLDIPALKSPIPGQVAMQANTALGFLLLGASLWLLQEKRAEITLSRRAALLCACGVFALGSVTLLEILCGLDLGIDRMACRQAIRTSFVSAVNFTLAGASLGLMAAGPRESRSRDAQMLMLPAAFLSVLSFSRFLYGAGALVSPWVGKAMALHSSILFIVSCLGVWSLRPQEGLMAAATAPHAGGLILRRIFPAAVALPLLFGWADVLMAGRMGEGSKGSLLATANLFLLGSYIYLLSLKLGRSDSRRRASEEALEQSSARYRRLCESVREGILTLDSATGLVVDSNPFLSELLEIPAEGLRGRRLWEVQAFQNAGFSKEACEDLRVRGSLELDELIFLGRDGNRIFVDFSAHAFEIGGGKFVSCRILDITRRKLLEESLRESQRKLRAVFDQTFQFIGLLSPDGILLDANRTALDFAGVALSAVVRKPYWDTPWWTHSPEQAERLRRAVRRSARGEFVRFEATHAAADGSLHYIDFSLKPVQNEEGRVAFLIFEGRNVTGTKKAVESAMIFFSGVEKAFDGFILMDTRGGITYANDSALQACGLSLREALQMNFGDLLRPKDAAPGLLSHALEKGKWLGEAQRLARGAGEFPAEMSLSAVRDSNGAPIAVLAVFRDASERVRAEKDLKSAKEDLEEKVLQRTVALTRANLELKKLSETLARAGKAKSDFLANMSHELRTPMNSIIGFSEVLQGESFGGLNQRQKDYVGYILISGKHLLSLINDVLDLSKVEAGRMELFPCEFSLSGLLDQAALWVQRAAQEKKIAVSREVPGDIGTLVGDERKIRQVLCNLLSNAVKFTPAGGRVGVRMKRTPEGVEVEVWDTGVGLSATDLGRIFSPFTRVESPLSRETQGAGLGLSLLRELVELHGGKIWIESDGPGKGASAKFTLPPSPPAAPEAA